MPDGELSQLFTRLAGVMNQRIAGVSSNVILVAAGIPLLMKGSVDTTTYNHHRDLS